MSALDGEAFPGLFISGNATIPRDVGGLGQVTNNDLHRHLLVGQTTDTTSCACVVISRALLAQLAS
jgi:hypothetical protein